MANPEKKEKKKYSIWQVFAFAAAILIGAELLSDN